DALSVPSNIVLHSNNGIPLGYNIDLRRSAQGRPCSVVTQLFGVLMDTWSPLLAMSTRVMFLCSIFATASSKA
ncbi:MAG: hypothetical protein AVDCRST_MAG93-9419, partial [uncultured Chloroflexia bacterium]